MLSDPVAFFKFLASIYLLVGFLIASFGTQAMIIAAKTIKREDRVVFLTPEDLALIYFRFMFLWGWTYIRPHWERSFSWH